MTEKQAELLLNKIDKLIYATEKKSSTSTPNNSVSQNNKQNDNKSSDYLTIVLNEHLKNDAKFIANQKKLNDLNEKLLNIKKSDVKLEQQQEAYIKKLTQLQEAKNKLSTISGKSQIKTHENLIKSLEEQVKLENERLENIRKISIAEQKQEKKRKEFFEKNKESINAEAKEREKIEKIEQKRKEKSEEKAKKIEQKIERNREMAADKVKSSALSTMGFQSNLLGTLFDTIGKLLEQDSIMSKLSANYSLSSRESLKLKQNILETSILTGFIGVKTEDLVKMQSSYTDEIGRSVILSKEGMLNLAKMAVSTGIGVDGATKMATSMELFGLNATSATNEIESIILNSRKFGMSTSVMTKKLEENLKLANTYTFKNGVRGVQDMTIYSSKFRINMQSIAGFADKISNPEGAIQTAASLQVLGGSFAQMADPMNLLNQGINDMEGLTKTYTEMLSGLADINKKTGEVTINGYDRLKIKAASEAAGISFEEMMTSVRAKAQRQAIGVTFDLNPVLKGDEEAKDLISSLAQFNKNKNTYEVNVNGRMKSISELSDEDIKKLIPDNLSMNTIAQNTMGLTDIIRNGFNSLMQTIYPVVIGALQKIKDVIITGFNYVSGFLGGGFNSDGTKNESEESINGAKARKRIGITGGAIGGAMIGGSIGSIIPGIGTGLGLLIGGLIGGLSGYSWGNGAFDKGGDVLIPSNGGRPIKLDNKDDVVAAKPGGAILQALTPSNDVKKTYGGVSNSYTNSYSNNKNVSSGSMDLNIQGSINLNTGPNSTKISATELMKDRNFVRELTRIIGNQMNRDRSGGKFEGGLNNNSF